MCENQAKWPLVLLGIASKLQAPFLHPAGVNARSQLSLCSKWSLIYETLLRVSVKSERERFCLALFLFCCKRKNEEVTVKRWKLFYTYPGNIQQAFINIWKDTSKQTCLQYVGSVQVSSEISVRMITLLSNKIANGLCKIKSLYLCKWNDWS